MIRSLGKSLVAALLVMTAACSASIDKPGSGASGTGSTAATGTGGSAGAAGTGPGGTAPTGSGGGGAPNGVCTPGVPVTSQIPRLTRLQYSLAVKDLLGVATLASASNMPPSELLYPDFDGPLNADAWRLYQDVATKIATQVMAGPDKSRFVNCDAAATSCLTDTIKAFGRKAFRRPLTDAEIARFMKLNSLTPKGTPDEVARALLTAFLVSPSFLALPELAPEKEGIAFRLSSYEIATRLSFLLWGSIPDDKLNAAADADALKTKEQILAEARRMIAIRDKTGPLVAAFHRSFLGIDNGSGHWWKIKHDTAKFPLYSDAFASSSAAELDAFFQDVAFGGGTFKDLFLSNAGYVTAATAAAYGLPAGGYGDQPTRVELDPMQRPGFLTRLGFLSSYSRFDATSPILRGAFITVNLLGVDPGPPLPNAIQVPAPPGDYKTERQYIEALTGQDSCKGCHVAVINPPGLVLENYDAIGKWQTVDPRGGPIDPAANVTFSSGNTKTIRSPRELMEEIAKTPQAQRIYAERWVSFATQRPPNPTDACLVNDLSAKLSNDGYSVISLLVDLTQADSFRTRARGN